MAFYESSEDEANPCQATPVYSSWNYNADEDEDDNDYLQLNEDYNSNENPYSQQRAQPARQKMEPCRYYNGRGCRDRDCPYLHVCRFSWIGSCRYGDSCHLKHVGDSDSDGTERGNGNEGGRQRRSARTRTSRNSRTASSSNDQLKNGEKYKWQLNGGQGWMDIANDHIIEAQYSKSYTAAITLYNTPWGAITVDFQLLQVRHRPGVQVRRLSSPHITWLWYFKGEDGWSQYGQPDSQGRCSKVNSSTLETEYQKNQQGSYQFKVTSYTYQITFRDMHQENLSTRCRRQVRRRPSYPATQSSVQANATLHQSQSLQSFFGQSTLALPRSMSAMNLSTAPKWQFSGPSNRWHNYEHRVGTQLECSTSNALIEAEYQKNPQGSMTFTVSGQSYVLDFAAMTQTNTSYGTVRKVRRV